MALWFTVFFLAPIIIIVLYAFLTRKPAGGVIWKFSLEGFRSVFTPGVARVTFNTIWLSLVSALLTILLALPCAYAMAKSRNKTLMLILVVIPFWTNFIIRILTWKLILDDAGVINSFLIHTLKIIDKPLHLIGNYGAVILIYIYMYLPYAILPLYSTIEKFDFTLLDAARDLGATKPQSMLKVLIPNIKSGIVTSVFFTFIPLLGSFVVQQMAGDATSGMYALGNMINDDINMSGNYPRASALSTVIMILTGIAIAIYFRLSRSPEAQPAKESMEDQGISVSFSQAFKKARGEKK